MKITGKNAKLYYISGGIPETTPTWVLLGAIKSVKAPLEKDEIDATTRDSGDFKRYIGGLKDVPVSIEMPYDNANTGFGVVQGAYFADTVLGIALMDGDIETAGSQGLLADFIVTGFDIDQPLDGLVMVNISLKLADTEYAPNWETIEAEPAP